MATSKGKRGASTDADTSSTEGADASQATRSRNNRSGSKTTGTTGDQSATRRGKNEPGQYQAHDDEDEFDATGDNPRTPAAKAPGSVESAFDDEDMAGDMNNENYDGDADDDIDWDDTPARGGGRTPDA